MPKIGEMTETANPQTGEVQFRGKVDIREVGAFTAEANPRCTGEETSPDFILKSRGREVGRMFPARDDVNGNPVRGIVLDGYPLQWAVRLSAFRDASGFWELVYRAPDKAAAAKEAA